MPRASMAASLMFLLNQREASPSASRRGGSALCQPTSALLHIGVGEGDDVPVQALQLHRASGGAHLLAAGARMLHGSGEVRVPGNRQRTGLAITSAKLCRHFRGRVGFGCGFIFIFLSGGRNRMNSYLV